MLGRSLFFEEEVLRDITHGRPVGDVLQNLNLAIREVVEEAVRGDEELRAQKAGLEPGRGVAHGHCCSVCQRDVRLMQS